MENPKAGTALNFKVGQLAEMRTFEHGFRGAWFRCKIKDIDFKKNKMWLRYYDFDAEELSWEKIYQVPPHLRKSKPIKRQLMLRPPYPKMYRKSEMPPVNSISQACVIIDGTWKVGDLVDWFESGCYWAARVTKVLSDDKVQVELPMPPSGEGKEGEEGKHEAFCRDLRPSLVWSETEGWSLPTCEGHTSCGAHLIFPTLQGRDLEPEHNPEPEPEPRHETEPAEAGSTTRKSGGRDGDNEQNEKSVKMDSDLMESSECISSLQRKVGANEVEVEKRKLNIMHEDTLEAVIIDLEEPAALDEVEKRELSVMHQYTVVSEQNEKSLKMDCDVMESSDSISSFQKKVASDEVEKIKQNIMHEDTLEAAVIDLQELLTKVKWMQRLLQSPSSDATTPSSWRFA